jgi:hypothetical protein
MAKIIVNHSENSVSVKVGSLSNRFFKKGELSASAGANQDEITIQDTVNNVYICRNFPYAEVIDSSGSTWGGSRDATVTNLNNVINATPSVFVKTTDDITSLSGVTSTDFVASKPGYGLFTGTTDGSLQSSDAIVLSNQRVVMGTHIDMNNFHIKTTTTNYDIRFTPHGTGSINLDGTVQFKRFDTTDPADIPTAEEGKMYADTDDNLFFGVSGS